MARNKDYRFVTKDPVVGIIQEELRRTGNLSNEQLERVAWDSGVRVETIKAWLYHDVRFPRSLTTRFVLETLGVTIQYQRSDGTYVREAPREYISETAQAKIKARDKKHGRHNPKED
jgi:hypothetical protein